MQGAKDADERLVQPAALAVLRLAATHHLVEARVDGQLVRRRPLPRLFGHAQVCKVEDAPLRMQLGKEDALAAQDELGHRHEAAIAQLCNECGRQLARPAEFSW